MSRDGVFEFAKLSEKKGWDDTPSRSSSSCLARVEGGTPLAAFGKRLLRANFQRRFDFDAKTTDVDLKTTDVDRKVCIFMIFMIYLMYWI